MLNQIRTKKKVVVAGHFCVDIIPDLNSSMEHGGFFELLTPGQLMEVGKAVFSTGGAASNTGISMHILDNDVSIIAMIGDDMLGRTALELVNRYGELLSKNIIVNPKSSSSYTIILDPPGIDRMFLHNPGANDDFTGLDMPEELFEGIHLFHFGYPTLMKKFCTDNGEQLSEMFKRVKQKNVTTSLDVSFPDPSSIAGKANWKTILEKTLPYVDVFSPSIEEILFMIKPDMFRELSGNGGVIESIDVDILSDIATTLLEMGTKIVLLKLGRKGLYLQTGPKDEFDHFGKCTNDKLNQWCSQKLWTSSYSVNVIGTTGAGDATIGGFLTALLHECLPEEALNFAAGVGACNVEAFDALGGVRSYRDTWSRIDSGWNKSPLSLNSDEWEWDGKYTLWRGCSGQ